MDEMLKVKSKLKDMSSIRELCLKKKQFSCFSNALSNQQKILLLTSHKILLYIETSPRQKPLCGCDIKTELEIRHNSKRVTREKLFFTLHQKFCVCCSVKKTELINN